MQTVASCRRWSAVALAVLLLGALFTVPSAVAQTGGAVTAAPGGHIQRFLVVSTNPSDNANPIVLGFGPIHARGVDKAVSNTKDIFRFPHGSLIVRHHRTAHAQHHDPATCFNTFSERGTYKVARGTGAYAGARGHGHYRVHVQFVACAHQRPQAFMLEIRAQGPLRL